MTTRTTAATTPSAIFSFRGSGGIGGIGQRRIDGRVSLGSRTCLNGNKLLVPMAFSLRRPAAFLVCLLCAAVVGAGLLASLEAQSPLSERDFLTRIRRLTVEGRREGTRLMAILQSPPTHSEPASSDLLRDSFMLFGLTTPDLHPSLAPAVAEGGARHLILPLASRQRLAEMRYDQATGRTLMLAHGFATIALVYPERPTSFHARNPFASGGVYEDPATGAAAAALAGYLRDAGWPHGGAIDILQGEDMGSPSRIHAEIPPETGASIRISGTVRALGI